MRLTLAGGLALTLTLGCMGAGDEAEWGDTASWDADSDTDSDADSDTDSDTDTDTDPDDGYDPEEESPYIELSPVAAQGYVFVANGSRSTITRIDSDTLRVLTAEIGRDPAVMATATDLDLVVLLSEGYDQVDIVDIDTLEVTSVPTRRGLNQLTLSPDGQWAICWYSQAAAQGETVDDSTWSWNEVSVVDLLAAEDHPQVVGFQPRDVKFDAAGDLAVVVSDAWLARIDLSTTTPRVERIQIAEDTVEPPRAEEVVVDPSGRWALVRQFQTTSMLLVDLDSGEVSHLDVGANATDLDVSPDGAWAVAVARASNQVWIYDLEDPEATPPAVLDLPAGAVLGSIALAPDGRRAILYSTATGESVFASWDLDTDHFELHGSVKPLAGVRMSPASTSALLLHPEDGGIEDTPFYNRHAVTVVDLADHFTNPVRLSQEPMAFADTEDGRFGFFLQEGVRALDVVDYQSLLVDEVPLQSVPVDVGLIPGTHTVFASQAHSLGRMSLYDADTEVLQTLTGFELNGEVDD